MSTIAIVALGLTLVIVVGEIDLSFGYMYGLASTVIRGRLDHLGLADLVRDPARVRRGAASSDRSMPSSSRWSRSRRSSSPSGPATLIYGIDAAHLQHGDPEPRLPAARPDGAQGAGRLLLRAFEPAPPVRRSRCRGCGCSASRWSSGSCSSRSLFGFRLKAIGGNPLAAELARLPVRKYKFAAFIICSMLASLAAILDFAFIGSTQPNAGLSLLFPVFAAVIIGGASLSGGRGHGDRHPERRRCCWRSSRTASRSCRSARI